MNETQHLVEAENLGSVTGRGAKHNPFRSVLKPSLRMQILKHGATAGLTKEAVEFNFNWSVSVHGFSKDDLEQAKPADLLKFALWGPDATSPDRIELTGKRLLGPMKSARFAGRNDPCLCGSGLKFKKCCGR